MQTSKKLAAMIMAFALLLVSCLFTISSQPAQAGGYGFPKQTEDAASASGDSGVMGLGVRNDANAALTGTDGDYGAAAITSQGFVRTSPQNNQTATYLIATDKFTPGASPTDIFEMSGSSSKVIYIQEIRIEFTDTQAGGYYVMADVGLLRRSTASSGGTATTITPQKADTNDGASSVNTCKYFTANPTVGTLTGTIGRAITSAGLGIAGQNTPAVLFKADTPAKALTLRGTSEFITINLGGGYLANNGGTVYATVYVKYSEATN